MTKTTAGFKRWIDRYEEDTRLAIWRIRKRLTMNELAERSGVSVWTVSLIDQHQNPLSLANDAAVNPRLRDLVQLAAALDLHPNAITEDAWLEWGAWDGTRAPADSAAALWFGRRRRASASPTSGLRARRAAQGLSLSALANLTAIPRSVISRLEHGADTGRIRELSRLGLALGCTDLEQILEPAWLEPLPV